MVDTTRKLKQKYLNNLKSVRKRCDEMKKIQAIDHMEQLQATGTDADVTNVWLHIESTKTKI